MNQWDHEPISYGFGPEAPWYRQRGPLTAAITGAAALLLVIIAAVIWLGGNGDATFGPPSTTAAPAPETTGTTPNQGGAGTSLPSTTVDAATTTTIAPSTSTSVDPGASTTTILVDDLTVWDLLQTRSNLSRVAELLVLAELDDVLRGEDQFTFFAPTNEALAAFEATAEGRAILADQGRVTTFLLRHLAFPRMLTLQQIFSEGYVLVATGEFLTADPASGTLDDVAFLLVDDSAGNGVLHVMEDVLAP